MKIPNKVKISGFVYDVEQTDDVIVLNARQLHGQIDYEQQKILLSNVTQGDQGKAQTFWHEVIHGFTHDRGIEWGENDEKWTDDLAKAFYAFCVDNKLDFVAGE